MDIEKRKEETIIKTELEDFARLQCGQSYLQVAHLHFYRCAINSKLRSEFYVYMPYFFTHLSMTPT